VILGSKLPAQLLRSYIFVTTTLQALGAFTRLLRVSAYVRYARIWVRKASNATELQSTLLLHWFCDARLILVCLLRGIRRYYSQRRNIDKIVDASVSVLGDIVSNVAALVSLI
jgi:hypothetical protein